MIRMGRSSKSEPAESTNIPSQSAPAYQSEPSISVQPKAVSESESIARDIKEGRLSGFVGHGTVLKGDTTFETMLRIDGQLTGSITSDGGTLIIGTNGRVDANISVAAANVNGIVNGDISASDKIHLGRTAKVIGNIKAPKLVIDEGALLEGTCTMLKSREQHDKSAADQIISNTSSASPAKEEVEVVEETAEAAA